MDVSRTGSVCHFFATFLVGTRKVVGLAGRNPQRKQNAILPTMEKVRNWLASGWQPLVLSLGGVLLIAFLLWFQLDGLVDGFSTAEIAQKNSVATVHAIRENPLNLPYKILQKSIMKLGIMHSSGRLASTLIGLALAVGFFFVLREWYTRRVAVLGTLLFICSAWFLHTARIGTDSIMYASLILVVSGAAWMQRQRSGLLAIVGSALLVTWLIYMPGMIWFLVPAGWWQFGRISRLLHKQRWYLLLLLAVFMLALITPLAWALYRSPELIKTYLGLPQALPSPLHFAKNVALVPIELFFRGPNTPETWLGKLPFIDWFGATTFAIGAYAYFFKRGLDRTRFIIYVFIVGTLLVALGGPVKITILLPFVYLIITGGIALLLQQWFTVFPRNPVARTTGAVLMTLAALMSGFYNVNHYFIAWPNAPETKQVFIEQGSNPLLQ